MLRQPHEVCNMLVVCNRYHNYAATHLRRINKNGRFSVPSIYSHENLVAVVKACILAFDPGQSLRSFLDQYQEVRREYRKIGTKVPDHLSEAELRKKIDDTTKDAKKLIGSTILLDCKFSDVLGTLSPILAPPTLD